MYTPEMFRITERDELLRIARELSFACVVTPDEGMLHASHVPAVLLERDDRIWLECHVARPNRHGELAGTRAESIAIFQGPQAYVHPGWYPSKQEHGKVVPTWCYITVHLHGKLERMTNEEELRAHLDALTSHMESNRPQPWAVADAPDNYVARMLRAIVGLRIRVDRMEGTAKLNQHRTEADRHGVIAGMASTGEPGPMAIAQKMREAQSGQ